MEIPDKQNPRAQLHLADVYVHEDDKKTVLDITLHNAGSQVALPTRAQIKVLDVGEFFYCEDRNSRSFLSVAQVYDVGLSPAMNGTEQTVKIAHQLRPGHSERFQLTVAHHINNRDLAYAWYCLQITILYDAQISHVQAQPILISVPPVNLQANNVWEDAEDSSCVAQNMATLQRMAQLGAARSASVEATIQKLQPHLPILRSTTPPASMLQPNGSTGPMQPNVVQQAPVTLGHNVRNSVFISYSRQDKRYLEGLQTQLAPYAREGSVTYWDDTKILPGSVWYKELEQALNSAKVAVFLVSADLLASDFIFKYELSPLLKAAKQEGVVIFSVVLSACAFMDTDLTNFQAVNAPSEPLNRMPRWKRDEVWAKTAKWIKNALS